LNKSELEKVQTKEKDKDRVHCVEKNIGYVVTNRIEMPEAVIKIHKEVYEGSIIYFSSEKKGIRIPPDSQWMRYQLDIIPEKAT
jgi:hypothetical protein